jgi:hypothetical protein
MDKNSKIFLPERKAKVHLLTSEKYREVVEDSTVTG